MNYRHAVQSSMHAAAVQQQRLVRGTSLLSTLGAMVRLRMGKKGVELRLHELEAAIMELVWAKGLTSFCVGDVLALLERKREIAYTTVMTTIARLYNKGLLARRRDARRYVYSPKVSRDEFLASTARAVLDGLGPLGEQAIALLAERVSEASTTELDALEDLIKRRRKELRK